MSRRKLVVNSIEFPIEFNEKYSVIVSHKGDKYSKHQKIAAEYIAREDVRGIFVNHSTGSGKTRTSLLAARMIGRPTLIVSPATLQNTFKAEYIKMHNTPMPVGDGYEFASGNAGNTYKQILTAGYRLTNRRVDKRRNWEVLNGLTIIVDEVHNIVNRIANTEGGTDLFNLFFKPRDVKIILVSASGLVQNPYEIAILINMACGRIHDDAVVVEGEVEYSTHTRLPLDYGRFAEIFLTKEPDPEDDVHTRLRMKSKSLMKRRISGVISMYNSLYSSSKLYPSILSKTRVTVHMHPFQFDQYTIARNIEQEIQRIEQHKSQEASNSIIPHKSGGSYRSKSRIVCNFARPSHLRDMEGNILSGITNDDLIGENLLMHSAKFAELLNRINSTSNEKILIYSNYKESGGIKLIGRILECNGWSNFNEGESGDDYKTFCMWHGDVTQRIRSLMQERFNDKNNTYGKHIRIIMITSAGSEGISLKAVRQIHIMEPYWNESRLIQVIGRGRRMMSHMALPEEDRNIKMFLYVSLAPEGASATELSLDGGRTTDEYIYELAIRKEKLLVEFRKVMYEASIDCSLNTTKEFLEEEDIVCMECTRVPGRGDKMYNLSIERDVIMPPACLVSCHLHNPKKISAKEAESLGFNTKHTVYRHNERMYVKLPEHDDVFVEVAVGNYSRQT